LYSTIKSKDIEWCNSELHMSRKEAKYKAKFAVYSEFNTHRRWAQESDDENESALI